MRRRKRRKVSGKMAVLYISMIVSLGAMGVGYAAWNDGSKVNMNITTGNIEIEGRIKNYATYADNVDYLDIDVNDDNVLKIEGIVYPGFNHDLDIDVIDKGSIPVVLKDIEENNDDKIAALDNRGKEINKLMTFRASSNKGKTLYGSLNQNEVRESFNLSIDPEISKSNSNSSDSSFRTMSISSSDEEGEIGILRSKIRDLEREIQEYRSINEKYEFKYKLIFEQGL